MKATDICGVSRLCSSSRWRNLKIVVSSGTGPRTLMGKNFVRYNALKLGLVSERIVVLPGEKSDEFESMKLDLQSRFGPENQLEQDLVRNVAVLVWKLRRCAALQFPLLPTVADARWRTVRRYEGALHRQLQEVLRELSSIQRARRGKSWQTKSVNGTL